MRWSLLVLFVAIPRLVLAEPKVAIAPLDGDEGGKVSDVVAEAASERAKVTRPARVEVAMRSMGVSVLSAKTVKKLRAKLDVDVVVYGSVERDGSSKRLSLSVDGGGNVKRLEVDFKTPKDLKKDLGAKLAKRIGGAMEGNGDDEEDEEEERRKEEKRKREEEERRKEEMRKREEEERRKEEMRKREEEERKEAMRKREEEEERKRKKRRGDDEDEDEPTRGKRGDDEDARGRGKRGDDDDRSKRRGDDDERDGDDERGGVMRKRGDDDDERGKRRGDDDERGGVMRGKRGDDDDERGKRRGDDDERGGMRGKRGEDDDRRGKRGDDDDDRRGKRGEDDDDRRGKRGDDERRGKRVADEDDDDDDSRARKRFDDEDDEEDFDDEDADGRGKRRKKRGKRHVLTQSAVWLDAGGAFERRTLTYDATGTMAPPPVGTAAPAGRLEGELYPGAFSSVKSIGAGFGVYGHYTRAFALGIRVPGTQVTAPVKSADGAIGARYRFAFGQHSLALGVAYWKRYFLVNRMGQTLDMPDVNYSAVAPGVAVRIGATPKLAAYATFDFPLMLYSGPIQDPVKGYGSSKILAFDLRGGVQYVLAKHVALQVGLEVDQVGLSFTKQTGSMSVTRNVSKATDRSIGLAATVGVNY